ncbi:hypothetical protein J6590_043787 [Homalodisca vitripennis]|nr:hypothetical protein J6590_043787 [Homalodisca vitripennis]
MDRIAYSQDNEGQPFVSSRHGTVRAASMQLQEYPSRNPAPHLTELASQKQFLHQTVDIYLATSIFIDLSVNDLLDNQRLSAEGGSAMERFIHRLCCSRSNRYSSSNGQRRGANSRQVGGVGADIKQGPD